jgi:cytochrome o ubiquinol oxidase operon protein cyoD
MSHEVDRNIDDVGPGFLGSAESIGQGILGYVIGLVLAALLTAASFGVVYTDLIWRPAIPVALVALAVAQIGVHLVFFLHLTTAPDNTNNALALAFGVLIVVLLIGGSLWIMRHLNENMAPMPRMVSLEALPAGVVTTAPPADDRAACRPVPTRETARPADARAAAGT